MCLYACVRVCGGMFAFECDSVYFVGLRTLERGYVVLSGKNTHMCLHEDLALCGCLFDKL